MLIVRSILLVSLVATAAPALAQPRVEVGGRVGGIGTAVGGLPLYGGVVTVHLTSRLALEADAALVPGIGIGPWTATGGLFQGAVRGRLVRSPRGLEWFWTAGGTGGFVESHLEGGPIRILGRTIVELDERRDRFDLPPLMPSIGSGAIVPLGPHLGLRADARLLVTPAGPGVLTFVGVTLPVGRFGQPAPGR